MKATSNLEYLIKKVYSNAIRPSTPILNYFLLKGATPSIFSINTAFAELYLLCHKRMYKKGLELRPYKTINLAGGILAPSTSERSVMSLLKSGSRNILVHQSEPFSTCTGRDSIFGQSITSIKKRNWPQLLYPEGGYQYVLLDYCQQEPAIAACFAFDQKLKAAYQAGDLYLYIGQHPALSHLQRSELKALVIPRSYGQSPEAYAKEHNASLSDAKRYWSALNDIFSLVDTELNHRSQLAFRDGCVRCLDWAARVTPLSNPLAVRNWPVQATGADIMRRAVIGLTEAGIDLRLTIHDSFLIRVPITEQDQYVAKAIAVIKQASALVLDGFELNVMVDGVFDGQVSGEMM